MTSPAPATCPEDPIESGYEAGLAAVDQLVAEAGEALERGDDNVVRERLQAALKLSPDNPEIFLALGHVELSVGDFKGALVHYTMAAEALPALSSAHSSRALVLQLLGDCVDAALAATRALSLDPANAVALKVLARIHLDAGLGGSAEKFCRLILDRDAGDADAGQMLQQALDQQAQSAKKTAIPFKLVPSVASAPSVTSPEQARESLEKFLAAGHDYFADVEPPELTELNLKNSRVLPSRFHILPLMPQGGVSAEVGTQIGNFAKRILSVMQPAKLHLFDNDFTPFDRAHFESAIQNGQVELHNGDSAALLSAMPDRYFDFIYIDGDHSYEGVVRDLEQAALKIKDDGWIVCNDYTPYSPLEKAKYGVCRAVNEFCLNRGFEIMYLGLHPWGYHDVAIRKHQHLGGAFLDAPDPNTFLPDVWEYLTTKYGVQSVLDVGAGAGWSTKWFIDRGIAAQGVEGWQEALDQSQCPENMVKHDYTNGPYLPAQPFDLCWSSEFVEHVEERFLPNLMATFQACKYVCITHAEVGQIGYHHVNCQTTEYWIKKMKEYGFEHDALETEYLRSTDTQNAPWGRRTLTFFVRKDVALQPMHAIASGNTAANGDPSALRPLIAPHNAAAKTVEPWASLTGPAIANKVIRDIGTGDEMFTGDNAHYFGVGQSALHCVQAALFNAAKDSNSIRKILDLPCGHGRVMRFFKAAFPQAQLTACDLNRGAVDFCAKTFAAQPVYSHLDVKQIPVRGKFDLIWSGSLLTHLRPEACAAFIQLFNSLINPGGLILFTLHGRWVERSLATGRYKYGLPDESVAALLNEYYKTGFGYADYPSQSGYGISVSSPAFVLSNLVSLPDLKLINYHEKGWDNHQDVVCLQKQSPAEPLG